MSNARRDNKLADLTLDGLTNALRVISYPHHEIHGGNGYSASKKFTHGAGASPNILIVTPDTTKYAHLVFAIISNAVVEATIYEGTDYTGGSALAAVNRNRNSANTSVLTLTTDATGASKGTAIWTFKAGANKEIVQAGNERLEFILKQNTKYLIETVGANGDLITALLDWYEHQR